MATVRKHGSRHKSKAMDSSTFHATSQWHCTGCARELLAPVSASLGGRKVRLVAEYSTHSKRRVQWKETRLCSIIQIWQMVLGLCGWSATVQQKWTANLLTGNNYLANPSLLICFSLQSKRNQLFVPLIEKAMAKLYGGYHRLSGGYTSEGMTSLTGFPCEILWLPPKKKHFASSQLKLTNNPSPPTVITDLAQQMEPLWSCMVNFVASGFLLSASCGRDLTSAAVQQSFPFTDCESYQSKGLLKNHAYSVLDIVECQDFRLVK